MICIGEKINRTIKATELILGNDRFCRSYTKAVKAGFAKKQTASAGSKRAWTKLQCFAFSIDNDQSNDYIVK
jgi:hypothetical protein